MSTYKADISLLVDGEQRKETVFPDLKYAVERAGVYPIPSVEPVNAHLHVTRFYDSVLACRESGMREVKCDLPEFYKSHARWLNLTPVKQDEHVHFVFYNRPSGAIPENEVLTLIGDLKQERISNVIFHPLKGCLEIHYSPHTKDEDSLNSRFLLYASELPKAMGGPLRSVNGRKI